MGNATPEPLILQLERIRRSQAHNAHDCHVCWRTHPDPNNPDPQHPSHPGLNAMQTTLMPNTSVWVGGRWAVYGVMVSGHPVDDRWLQIKILPPGLTPQIVSVHRQDVWLTRPLAAPNQEPGGFMSAKAFYVTVKVTPDPAADEDPADAAEGFVEAAMKNWAWTGGDLEVVKVSDTDQAQKVMDRLVILEVSEDQDTGDKTTDLYEHLKWRVAKEIAAAWQGMLDREANGVTPQEVLNQLGKEMTDIFNFNEGTFALLRRFAIVFDKELSPGA